MSPCARSAPDSAAIQILPFEEEGHCRFGPHHQGRVLPFHSGLGQPQIRFEILAVSIRSPMRSDVDVALGNRDDDGTLHAPRRLGVEHPFSPLPHQQSRHTRKQHRNDGPCQMPALPEGPNHPRKARIDSQDHEAQAVDSGHGSDLSEGEYVGVAVSEQPPRVPDEEGCSGEEPAAPKLCPYPTRPRKDRQQHDETPGQSPVGQGSRQVVRASHHGEDGKEQPDRYGHRLIEVVRHRAWKPVAHGPGRPEAPKPDEEG